MISPFLLNEVMEKFFRRLTEVSFELQGQDLLSLFRSVHTLQELQHHHDTSRESERHLFRPFFRSSNRNTSPTSSLSNLQRVVSSLVRRKRYTATDSATTGCGEQDSLARVSSQEEDAWAHHSRDRDQTDWRRPRRQDERHKGLSGGVVERLKNHLVHEIPYRVASLDPHVAHDLLAILGSETHAATQVDSGHEARRAHPSVYVCILSGPALFIRPSY